MSKAKWALLVLIILILTQLLTSSANTPCMSIPALRQGVGHNLPQEYYGRACIIPWYMSLDEWLTCSKWCRLYEKDGWDCSRMTAFTEWVLSNCGHETRIAIGTQHAWLEIKVDGTWVAYEATSRHFVKCPETRLRYNRQRFIAFNSLHDLIQVYRSQWKSHSNLGTLREWIILEWGWWRED